MKIRHRPIGPGHPVYIIAEIGINHNGSVEHAMDLIEIAKACGCDAVKFQKRTPELCVPEAQRNVMRETPWGLISYMDYRRKIEFGVDDYSEINAFCRDQKIDWFASCWDIPSVEFIEKFDVPAFKVASACVTDNELIFRTKLTGRPLILSTGMCESTYIDAALAVVGRTDIALLHATSTYPALYEELNLRCIPALAARYGVPVGYSGHESGLPSTLAAVALGACIVERHITKDRAGWGSDQSASLGPGGLARLVSEIRLVEKSMGDGIKRIIDAERPLEKRLRRIIPKAVI